MLRIGGFKKIYILLLVTMLLWGFGPSLWTGFADAANVTLFKDVLSTSAPNVTANHTISYTAAAAVTAGQTMALTFDPTTSRFTIGGLGVSDITFTGATLVAACGAGTDEVTMATTTVAITFTVCAGDTVTSGAKTIAINNGKITNPNTTGSYIVRLNGSQSNTGDTMVAIVNTVTMTAAVDTSFTFTVTGVNSGQTTANGEGGTTSITTTATTIPWGTLVAGSAKTARQDLAVSTNATNGFVVTLQQNQNMTSSTGADIDLFSNGAATAVPAVWAAPTGTLAAGENGYGHYGITSEDSDLNGDEFNVARYAGNIASARQIFSNNGPADGTTADKGATKIGFKIQISALQEAGNDYTNTLMYIATPTF